MYNLIIGKMNNKDVKNKFRLLREPELRNKQLTIKGKMKELVFTLLIDNLTQSLASDKLSTENLVDTYRHVNHIKI